MKVGLSDELKEYTMVVSLVQMKVDQLESDLVEMSVVLMARKLVVK